MKDGWSLKGSVKFLSWLKWMKSSCGLELPVSFRDAHWSITRANDSEQCCISMNINQVLVLLHLAASSFLGQLGTHTMMMMMMMMCKCHHQLAFEFQMCATWHSGPFQSLSGSERMCVYVCVCGLGLGGYQLGHVSCEWMGGWRMYLLLIIICFFFQRVTEEFNSLS